MKTRTLALAGSIAALSVAAVPVASAAAASSPDHATHRIEVRHDRTGERVSRDRHALERASVSRDRGVDR